MIETQTIGIFLIEDNENYKLLLREMLHKNEKYDFNVSHSSNLKDGIDGIKKNEVDIIVLDLDLPDSSGLNTLKTLNSVVTDIPIIVLTGSRDEENMLRSLSVGAQDYLLKSEVTNREVIRSIMYTIERYKKYREQMVDRSSDAEYFQNIVKDSALGILVIDRFGRVIFANESALHIMGRDSEELIGKSFGLPIVDGEKTEIDIVNKHGVQTVVEMSSKETEFSGEKVYVVSISEITEHKKMQEYFKNLSITDSHTNLYNRRGFENLAEKYLELSKRIKRQFLIAFFDVDGLKSINDSYGHSIGSMALNDVAAILLKTFRKADIVSRWGGDEFVVLVANAEKKDIDLIKNRFNKNLGEYKNTHTRPYKLSLSIGFSCFYPDNPADLNTLVNEADESMYRMEGKS